jgi:hypothetical protein
MNDSKDVVDLPPSHLEDAADTLNGLPRRCPRATIREPRSIYILSTSIWIAERKWMQSISK